MDWATIQTNLIEACRTACGLPELDVGWDNREARWRESTHVRLSVVSQVRKGRDERRSSFTAAGDLEERIYGVRVLTIQVTCEAQDQDLAQSALQLAEDISTGFWRSDVEAILDGAELGLSLVDTPRQVDYLDEDGRWRSAVLFEVRLTAWSSIVGPTVPRLLAVEVSGEADGSPLSDILVSIVADLLGSADGASVASGSLVVVGAEVSLAGTSVGSGVAAGALDLLLGLSGESSGVGVSTGALDLALSLSGASSGSAAVSATADLALALSGSSTGAATLTGTLDLLLFSPADLSPSGWWRADLGHAEADGGTVQTWANQGTAGSAADLVQSNASLRPVFDEVHATFNDQSVMVFDGTRATGAAADPWWHMASLGDSNTLLVIARCTDGTSAFKAVVQTGAFNTAGGIQRLVRPGQTGSRHYYYSVGGTPSILTNNNDTASITTTDAHALASLVEGSGGGTTIRAVVDGVQRVSTSGSQLRVAASTNQYFAVGSSAITSASNPFIGEIAEIVYLKRLLTAGEESNMVSYLNDRYGFSLTALV